MAGILWSGIWINRCQDTPHKACSVTHSYLILYDPLDCSPPGSSVPGISQARRGERGGLPFPTQGDPPDPGIDPESPALGRWILSH